MRLPVWMMKPSRKKGFRKILAAVDLNLGHSTKKALAKQILSLATTLAEQHGGKLFTSHAWE